MFEPNPVFTSPKCIPLSCPDVLTYTKLRRGPLDGAQLEMSLARYRFQIAQVGSG